MIDRRSAFHGIIERRRYRHAGDVRCGRRCATRRLAKMGREGRVYTRHGQEITIEDVPIDSLFTEHDIDDRIKTIYKNLFFFMCLTSRRLNISIFFN